MTKHREDVPLIRTGYSFSALTEAFVGQDAVICVVGPAGVGLQSTFIDAAEAAGVKRFIVDDFGWGPDPRSLPEFGQIHAQRRLGWHHAKERAEANADFTWTGVSTGNPIDWVGRRVFAMCTIWANASKALRKFPMMGFDVAKRTATIYDDGTEHFTGTTLAGIGQAVVGVMQHPQETANRFVKVCSIKTCQNELVAAFLRATGQDWEVGQATTKELKARGEEKFKSGTGGWVLDLVVAQLYDQSEARCVVAPTREESDAQLLAVIEESVDQIVRKALGMD